MRIFVFLLFFCGISFAAHAESYFAYGASVGNYTVSDPDGDTGTETASSLLNLAYLSEYSRDLRYVAEFFQYDFTLSAGTSEIGQKVETTGFALGHQWRWRITRDIKPWIGAGVTYESAEFTARHTVDSDGFLLQSYPNRDESILGGYAAIMADIELSERFALGAIGRYTMSFADGISGVQANVYLMYKFR